jgi:SAM-dependent methyltransferase
VSPDVWAIGEAYERYVGRWSHRVAVEFLAWLEPAAGLRWLDVGCGTGALTSAILTSAHPSEVIGVDPSAGFLERARAKSGTDERLQFQTGSAEALPLANDSFDAVVSGLVLNFIPDSARALAECVRVAREGGLVACYVWDYAVGMQMVRFFWDAAATLDPAAGNLDEGVRFALCRPEPLRELWTQAGLTDIQVGSIDIPTVFTDFDDYWAPFLGGQGPAPGYLMSLSQDHRYALADLLRERLPAWDDGSIVLKARAWAIQGCV